MVDVGQGGGRAGAAFCGGGGELDFTAAATAAAAVGGPHLPLVAAAESMRKEMTAAGVTATATAVSAAKPATTGRTRQPHRHRRAAVAGTSL